MRLVAFSGFFVFCFFLVISCQREYSLEDVTTGFSSGSLKTVSGDCMPSGTNGSFKKSVPVDSTNYIYLDIDVSKAGSYVIKSDTVNGLSFSAEGFFDGKGIRRVILPASGTPFTNGTVPFGIHYGVQKCIINVFTIQ